MQTVRIAELLEPYLGSALNRCHSDRSRSEGDGAVEEPAVLSSAQLQSISTYIDILLRWNARINLTAIRDPEEIVTRHFGESLFAARHLFPQGTSDRESGGRAALQGRVTGGKEAGALATVLRVADVGSGPGFPGIPIKLWAPDISLTLIESNQKKATFLREVARALTLTDVNIQTVRAETMTQHTFDVVTLRAVERFESILPIAASLIGPAGRLALLIGSAQHNQARSILPSLYRSDPLPIPGSESRILLIANAQPNQIR
jgi:16S rRNA (guanine527-N7)-methyltransferase